MITQEEATKKVQKLKETTGVDELAQKLGMSKVTMYTRLENSNWKKPELYLINEL